MSSSFMDKYLTVRMVTERFGLSRYSIYELIRSNPTFPYINIGPKKNYRIHSEELEVWLSKRTRYRSSSKLTIPSVEEVVSKGSVNHPRANRWR
ncbi:MAG: helix-turn-helix domain-containing protein [Oligoflexia bacterium]|nr:helix-turn-helix domain-containing protein [Oligoflexia bacterium]